MLINIDDCKGLDMKLCQLAEEEQLTDEQFRYFTEGWRALWGMIIKLPSADRPQGEWIECGSYYKCPFCEEIEFESDGKTNFCPNCGARMREINNE